MINVIIVIVQVVCLIMNVYGVHLLINAYKKILYLNVLKNYLKPVLQIVVLDIKTVIAVFQTRIVHGVTLISNALKLIKYKLIVKNKTFYLKQLEVHLNAEIIYLNFNIKYLILYYNQEFNKLMMFNSKMMMMMKKKICQILIISNKIDIGNNHFLMKINLILMIDLYYLLIINLK